MTRPTPTRSTRPVALKTLLGFALACAGTFAFFWLAAHSEQSSVSQLDRHLLLSLRTRHLPSDPIGPLWVEEAIRDITSLGSVSVLGFVTIALASYFVVADRRRLALILCLAVASGFFASSILKATYDRPRPQVVPHRMHVFTQSFPSGHAMLSTVTYLTAASLLAKRLHRRREKVLAMLVAFVLVGAIGVSRVYLGVHWPSDVLGGWLAGSLWAAAILSLSYLLEPKV